MPWEIIMPKQQASSMAGVVRALGLVFGDIGTSPIYTLTVIFLILPRTEENILGTLSLIIWTLVILVSLEYGFLAMALSRKGEGGTIVLKEILAPLLTKGRSLGFAAMLAYVGISLLAGDGVITPAISILSAVEGVLLIPGCDKIPQSILIAFAAAIAGVLFAVQRKGTEKVSAVFGPVMLVWFGCLSIFGLIAMVEAPIVLSAFSPLPGLRFLFHNGFAGFLILGEVILCATGGEALYADMGHLGREPIVRAWRLVFGALVLSYLGQGAFLLRNPETDNVLFGMVVHIAGILYIPFLLLSIAATIIASQAMISGMFSVFYQGMTTRIMPLFKVDYTSTDMRSQIYIGAVNWFLLASVLLVMLLFQESHKLAAAYGLAVTGTMTITGIMMMWIFLLRKFYYRALLAALVTVVDLAFLASSLFKIPHGGYWSLVLAAIPLFLILVFTRGQKRLYRALKPLDLDVFLDRYTHLQKRVTPIYGTALFFARDMLKVPPYLDRTMCINHILYSDNIVVSITRTEEPFGVAGFFRECYAEGLRQYEIILGYTEIVDVGRLLREAGINPRAIFYGIEDISTENVIWQLFSLIKRLTPSYVQFYKLPPDRLHGVVTRVEM